MAVDRDTFVLNFPEFTEMASDGSGDLPLGAPEVIDRALRDAARFVGRKQWGTRYEDGVFVKAAALLALTPFGENMRLKGTMSSPYAEMFRDMQRSLPYRFALTGGGTD